MCVKSLFLHLDASEEQQGEKASADDGKGGRGKFSQPFLPLMNCCLLYTSPSPRDLSTSRMPSSA